MTGLMTADHDVWLERQHSLVSKLARIAIQNNAVPVTGKDNLVVRPILPAEDLNSGAENNWTDSTGGNPDLEWRQDWSAGGATADAYNEGYAINQNSLSEEKVIGFYGISASHTNIDARQLRFTLQAYEGNLAEINIESLETESESKGLFFNDVIYEPNTDGSVKFWIDQAQDDRRMALHGFVAEAAQETLQNAVMPDFPPAEIEQVRDVPR